MASVTQRIKQVKQPRGGYIKPKECDVFPQGDDGITIEDGNINPCLVGLAVDYLTRFECGAKPEHAFIYALHGAKCINQFENGIKLLLRIKGLDDQSIISACKLVGYDVCYRAGEKGFVPVETINPDTKTIVNIRFMVIRSKAFFCKFGPVVRDGFRLNGAYTDLITAGDGDFLTADTLWEFKVLKGNITKDNTLQLLIYYLMGLRSNHQEQFKQLTKLGIFNPRLNLVYLLNIADINPQVIEEVNTKVIGYQS